MKWSSVLRAALMMPLLAGTHLVMASEDSRQAVYREQLWHSVAYGEGIAVALKGAGKRGSSRTQPNEHYPNQTDEIYSEHLPGIEILWLRPGPAPNLQLLYSLRISKEAFALPLGLSIGKSVRKDVLGHFGTPNEQTTTALVYHLMSNIGADTLVFYFQGERLSLVEWRWAND